MELHFYGPMTFEKTGFCQKGQAILKNYNHFLQEKPIFLSFGDKLIVLVPVKSNTIPTNC